MARRVFSITELRRTGAGVIEPTPLVFRWTGDQHAMPIGAIPLHLKVNTSRDEIPGGVDVVEQVGSVAWQPFRIGGKWVDSWGGQNFATTQLEAFRRLVERAPLVRIEFEGITLTGLITDFMPVYERRERIGWEITFSPHRYGAGAARIVIPHHRSARPMTSHVATVAARADELTAARDAAMGVGTARPVPMVDETILDQVLDGIGSINSAIARARQAATGGLAANATRTLLAIAGTFRAVRDAAHALSLSLVHARSDLGVAFDSATESLEWVKWSLGTRRVSLATVRDAERAEQDARALARQKPRAIHRPAIGESLYLISQRYYGTADGWRRIYEFNGLTSLRLTGTEQLIIPERAT